MYFINIYRKLAIYLDFARSYKSLKFSALLYNNLHAYKPSKRNSLNESENSYQNPLHCLEKNIGESDRQTETATLLILRVFRDSR